MNVNMPEMYSLEPVRIRAAAARMQRFADKYREDGEYRAEIDQDPAGALAEGGVVLPPSVDVRFVEDSADVFHFVLPPEPHYTLEDEALEAVAGGGKSAAAPAPAPAPNYGLKRPDTSPPAPRDSDCFLTTAVVERRGEADDGPTLTALRGFRDGYMMETAQRRALVEDYYRTAPAVVSAIPAQHADWGWIGERIDAAVAAIGNGDDEAAFTIYVGLMERLAGRWIGQDAESA